MKKKKQLKIITDFLMMTIGAMIAAFAIEEFLVPCTILDGGVVGISIMINNLSGFSLSLLTIMLNIPFLLLGSRFLGKFFILKSGYSMVVFSVFLKVFEHFSNATDEYLLAVCFGGVILGIGAGLVIRFGGCLDGTETIAILLNRKYKMPVGQTVMIINVVIYIIAGIVFDFDRAMYSLLTYFITSKVLDMVEGGVEQAKAAMIITEEAGIISEQIFKQLGRTVTLMEGEGLVSGKKVVMYCVLTRFEIHELKSIIEEVDASAFIAISDVSEIIGNHVKKKGVLRPKSDCGPLKKTIAGQDRQEQYAKECTACRGFLIRDEKIAVIHEVNTGFYQIPGGALEKGETLKQCCKREILEETGYAVKTPEKPSIQIDEYYGEWKFTSYYFLCDIKKYDGVKLTEEEKENGAKLEWLDLEEAKQIFAGYEKYRESEPKKYEGFYREYEALKMYEELKTDTRR